MRKIIWQCVIPMMFILFSCNSMPEHNVKKEETFIGSNKAIVEIELTKKEPAEEIEKIAQHYLKKYEDKHTMWVYYYVPDKEDCYATSHRAPILGGYEGVKFLY